MFTMGDIIDMAVQIEKNAAAVYADAADRVEDPDLANTLHCLVADKKRHAARFRKISTNLPESTGASDLEKLGRAMLKDVIGEQSFSLSEANFWQIKQPEDLLAVAVYFEADKQAFYRILQSFVADDRSNSFLESIIAEESDHIKHLQRAIECRRQKPADRCSLC